MAQAERDENSIAVALAYDGSTTKPLKVDPTTGRLLVAIVSTGNGSGTRRARERDENSIPVSQAYNDNTGENWPLITGTNNELVVDIG